MGTTCAPVNQTIGELTKLLVHAGAINITTSFSGRGDGAIIGLIFCLPNPENKLIYSYQLPVRTENLYKKIHSARIRVKSRHEEEDRKQAEKVAWRQLFRWCEAQIALSDTGLVETREVFLPYLLQKDGRSFFQLFVENEKKMLGAGKVD
jgi:hypothetical protein